MKLGTHQRAILAAMRAGAVLHNDNGMWGWTKEDDEWIDEGRFVASSCVGLLNRGLIYEVKRLPRYGAFGQDRVVYGLTWKGEQAL